MGTRKSTPHHLCAAPGHLVEQLTGTHPEMDPRHAGAAHRLQHPSRVGGHRAAVLLGRQGARPAVEQLHRGRPRLHLGQQRGDGKVGEAIHEVVPQRLVAQHQRLGPLVVARRPALHQVGRHRERGAREADQGDVEDLDGPADGLDHVRRVGSGIQGTQTVEVAPGREGALHDRARAGHDLHAEAGGVDRHHDVAEEDGCVDPVAAHRLKRDLRGPVGGRRWRRESSRRPAPLCTPAASGRPGA